MALSLGPQDCLVRDVVRDLVRDLVRGDTTTGHAT